MSRRTLDRHGNPIKSREEWLYRKATHKSHELIYEYVMRNGGEPFGQPYEISTSTLTEKIVKFFKQKGFFGFEFMEKANASKRKIRNKFTRYGAAPFRGPHQRDSKPNDKK